jgi:hypothetical protein
MEIARVSNELIERTHLELVALFAIAGGFTKELGVDDARLEEVRKHPMAVRRCIKLLETGIRQAIADGIMTEEELPVKHTFADGMYTREMFIPKGTIVIGKIHKQECMNFCVKGKIYVATETGSMLVEAPYSVASPAGLQRIGYAMEDTIWINVFRTDETDSETILDKLAWNSFEEMETQLLLKDEKCQ